MTIKYPNGVTWKVEEMDLCNYADAYALALQMGGQTPQSIGKMYPAKTEILEPDAAGRDWWGLCPDPKIYPHSTPGMLTSVTLFLSLEVGPGRWGANQIGDVQWLPLTPAPKPAPSPAPFDPSKEPALFGGDLTVVRSTTEIYNLLARVASKLSVPLSS